MKQVVKFLINKTSSFYKGIPEEIIIHNMAKFCEDLGFEVKIHSNKSNKWNVLTLGGVKVWVWLSILDLDSFKIIGVITKDLKFYDLESLGTPPFITNDNDYYNFEKGLIKNRLEELKEK